MNQVNIFNVLRGRLFSALIALVGLGLLLAAEPQAARGETGNVYVLTNQQAGNGNGNSIMVFHRDAKGVLTPVGEPVPVLTGGNGNGTGQPGDVDPLASQNSLVLSGDGRLLFAVNAGSNSVTVFAASGDRLTLLNTVSSGGTCPVSIAVQGDLVYVLNAGIPPAGFPIPPTCTLPAGTTQTNTGTPGTISGFRIDARTNRLVTLPNSTQPLPGGAIAFPAQVSFSPDGSVLIVTEKITNLVDTFVVDGGVAQPGVAFPSNGVVPFGFAFGPHDVAIVSNANGAPPPGPTFGSSSLTSYQLNDDGSLAVVTPALPDNQLLACWVNIPNNGNFAYTSNTSSGNISSYTVSSRGKLALLNSTAASINGGASAPTNMAFSKNSRFLYVSDAANGAIVGFRVGSDGSLTQVTIVTGVPFGSEGIAAR